MAFKASSMNFVNFGIIGYGQAAISHALANLDNSKLRIEDIYFAECNLNDKSPEFTPHQDQVSRRGSASYLTPG
jgi:hypothetical protein